jgi:hypothetical protein
MDLPAPGRCNCLVWLWRVLRARGGGVYLRRSYRKRFIIHAEWVPYPGASAEEIIGYSPINPKRKWWDAIWFKGHVISDAEDLRRAQRGL